MSRLPASSFSRPFSGLCCAWSSVIGRKAARKGVDPDSLSVGSVK
nr:MAG TPA: hypothetical protein [Caudoviricetes sp.]